MVLFGFIALAPSPFKKVQEKSYALKAATQTAPKPIQAVQKEKAPDVPVVAQTPEIAPPVAAPSDCESQLSKYDWPQATAHRVMMQESTNRAWIVNDNPSTSDYSIGCFEINLYGSLAASRPSEAWLSIAENNVSYAYGLYKSHGSSFWGSWPNTCRKVGCE